MNADEMFEKLGYNKKRKEKFLDEIIEEHYEMATDIKEIVFYYESNTIDLFGGISLDVTLLQAINKKVEELGWNEELKISDKEITLDDYELTNLTEDGFVIKLKDGESYKVYKGSILPRKILYKKRWRSNTAK